MEVIYQFKISVKRTSPIIWRRIHVPSNYTMHQLHGAIVESVGWCDFNRYRDRFIHGSADAPVAWFETNLYQFDIRNGSQVDYIGLRFEPSFFDGEENIRCAKCVNVTDVFEKPSDKVIYSYDFRREWTHEVILQRILPKSIGTKYPKCVAGSRCCPPYSCEKISDYVELLKICDKRDQRNAHGNHLYPDLNSGGDSVIETFDPDKFTIDVKFIPEEHHSVLDIMFLPSIYCYGTCRRENHPNSQF